jgi:hypothetical protein
VSTGEKAYHYRGDLGTTALPEMLFTIHRHRVPGIVQATRDGVSKRVYLKDGNVIFAESGDREDSLGKYLLRNTRLTPAQFDETMRQRAGAHQRYGEILIESKLLTPAEIYQAIRSQVQEIVWSLFEWEHGEVTFRIGEFQDPDAVRIDVPLRQVILRGIERAADAKRLVSRLGRKETVFDPTYRTSDLVELALDAAEYKLLQMVNGKRSLYEICTRGPRTPAENGKLLYAFQVLSLVRRQAEPHPAGIKIRFRTEGDEFS